MKLRLVLILALAGCADDSDPEAPKRCDELAQSFCEVNARCALETGTIAEEQLNDALNACISGLKQSFNCATVTKIKKDPELCVSDLAATPCDEYDATSGLPIPDSCRGVFER